MDMYSTLIVEQPGNMKQAVNLGKLQHQALSLLRPHGALCDVPKPTTAHYQRQGETLALLRPDLLACCAQVTPGIGM